MLSNVFSRCGSVLCLALIAPSLANAQNAKEEAQCEVSAVTDYGKAMATRLQSPSGSGVEELITQRRLREQYCLQLAQCKVAAQSQKIEARFLSTIFEVHFVNCLKGEAFGKSGGAPISGR